MCIALLPPMLPSGTLAAEEAPPDADFLEYLGLMVEEDGEYLDLMDLAEVPEADITRTAELPSPATSGVGDKAAHRPETGGSQ